MRWRRYPLIRLLFAFIAGIVLAVLLPDVREPAWWMLLLPAGGCVAFVLYRNTTFQYRFEWLFGIMIFTLFLLFGWKRTDDSTHFIDKHHFSQIPNVTAYSGYIEEEAAEKARSWKSVIQLQHVYSDDRWIPAHGKLLCYFSKDSTQTLPRSGEVILFYTPPDSIPPPLNPYAFDYRSYLQQRGIGHRVYLTPDRWTTVEGSAPFSLSRIALNVRGKLLNILENSPLTASEYGVVSAILLGYDDKLDPEQRMLYANAGAAHILCVSGMHVGVIFMIFSVLLSFLDKTKKGKLVRCVLLLLLTWSYALITGLAPAVSRAAIMLSFVIVAQASGRRNNTWNAIVGSALFLLIMKPLLLLDVGFQLSYSAVIAIVALQRPLYNLVQVPTWLGNQVWSLITVSIAAQLGTAPFAIYYFHQFPTWFLLTNLIVIPFSTLVIYTGMAVLCFSSVAFLKTAFGWLLLWEVRALNMSIQWINDLPGSVISAINMTLFEAFLLTILIIAAAIFFLQKHKPALTISLICLLLLCINFTIERAEHNHQKEFIVFEAGRSPAMGFVNGRNMVIVTDSAFSNNANSQSFVVNEYITRKGIKNIRFETASNDCFYDEKTGLYRINNAFFFNNDKIFVIAQHPAHPTETPLDCDYLIIRNSYYGEPSDYLSHFQCANTVIVDGSNSKKMQQQWRHAQDSLASPVYFPAEQGAWRKRY
ncbi:MAG: ComEC family competence protein [Bacteroidales bacterium]|nr:ComEC family competence protein [Bacteroidales bacterium]